MAVDASRFKEEWIELGDGQAMCALINGDVGWLLYLREDGDAGFSSRNPDYTGSSGAQIEFRLSDSQQDSYPASWTLPVALLRRALEYFERERQPPMRVTKPNEKREPSRCRPRG